MRFLEREVYAFAGSRRNAVSPHFLFMGGPRKQVMDRPQMGRGQHARGACGQSNTEGTAGKSCAGKGKTDVFFFSGKDRKDVCFVLQVEVEVGAQLSRPWGIGTAAKTARAQLRLGWSTGGNPACRGLIPSQLIQLIYLRYLCESVKRKKRMDVCFLLTLYI